MAVTRSTAVEDPIAVRRDDECVRRPVLGSVGHERGIGNRSTPEAYWRAVLAGFIPLPFLSAGLRADEREGEVGRLASSLRLSLHATSGLKELVRKADSDLSTAVFAAWGILLSRFSAQDDVLFGNATGSAPMTPIRLKIEPTRSLKAWLPEVADQVRVAAQNGGLPLGQIQELSDLPPRVPLFETAISWAPDAEPDQKLPLMVRVSNISESGLEILAEYDGARFREGAVSYVLEAFRTLLEAMTQGSQQTISELSLVSEEQLTQQLIDWNRTETGYPDDQCVSEFLEAQARRSPAAVALTFREQSLRYDELDRRANRLAHHLRKAGAGPECIVAICIERSLELLVGLLAIWKAGAAYLPLDPTYPRERLQFMLQDSGAQLLLVQEHLIARFSETPQRIVRIDSDWGQVEAGPCTSLGRTAESGNLAYVIYTSGSTGKPKGVMIEHRQLANFFTAMDRAIGTEPGTWLAVTSVSFDISVLELFWTLSRGFHVVLQAETERLSPGEFSIAAQIARHRVSHLQCTPSLARILVSTPDCRNALARVQKLLIGGESLPPSLAAELGSATTAEIYNMYGPTETTVWSAAHRLNSNEQSITVGRPIANTYIYILDQHRNPLPIGAPGELFIGGAGVARGYLHRPELTGERFQPNPFRLGGSDRIYKTGDLARYRPNGDIEILGRIDNQIKILGVRVEVEEIETILGRHPQVRATAVIAREHIPGEVRLVAYVVPVQEQPSLSKELRVFLQQKLPPHMLPSAFVFVDSLPHTPNGKIDRKALSALGELSAKPPASGEIEQILIEWLSKSLGTTGITPHDDYFDLGGTSILAVELFAKIRQTFGVELGLATLFEARTMTALANIIRAGNTPAGYSCVVPIRAGGVKTPLFILHGAGGSVLGFNGLAKHLDPGRPIYGIQAQALDKRGPALVRAEDLAALYVRELRSTQPQGPYCLLGYSLGGIVAFEMAQQLHAAGEPVAFLGVLDVLLKRRLPLRKRVLRFLKQTKFDLAATLHGKDGLAHLTGRLRAKALRIVYTFFAAAGRPAPRSLGNAFDINWFAAVNYRPRVYPGRLVLFRTRDEDGQWDREMGWGGLATNGIEVHEVPGNHFEMFTGRHAEALAEIIENHLG